MARKNYTEEYIIAVLNEAEAGARTLELCRRHGMSEAAFQTPASTSTPTPTPTPTAVSTATPTPTPIVEVASTPISAIGVTGTVEPSLPSSTRELDRPALPVIRDLCITARGISAEALLLSF